MSAITSLPPDMFAFLSDLERNNRREWFQANKQRYEQSVKDPALGFIADFAPRLAKISPHFKADPKPVGGSLFRIYRDTRFSKDKTPYKTNVGIHFRHRAGKDVHAPGFYLHLACDEVFLGAGLWHPESSGLAAIRQRIDGEPDAWLAAKGAVTGEGWSLGGDSLKRAPRGYPKDHPLLEDLRRKDHIASVDLTEDDEVVFEISE